MDKITSCAFLSTPKTIEKMVSGTPKQLAESMVASFSGMGNSVVAPAIRFLIAAARDAGLPISPHIAKRQIPASAGLRRRTKKTPKQVSFSGSSLAETPSESPTSVPVALLQKFPNFDPSWSPDQQKSWFDAYGKLLDMTSKNGGKNND